MIPAWTCCRFLKQFSNIALNLPVTAHISTVGNGIIHGILLNKSTSLNQEPINYKSLSERNDKGEHDQRMAEEYS
jgi:hypothetical protein